MQQIGFSVKGKAFFNEMFGTCENKPMIAAQDSTGRIQCLEAKTKDEAEKQAQELKSLGFKILVGVG